MGCVIDMSLTMSLVIAILFHVMCTTIQTIVPHLPHSTSHLPAPKALHSNLNESLQSAYGCSVLKHHLWCSCYSYDDGLFVECRITMLDEIKDVLNLIESQPIKSFSIYNMNQNLLAFNESLFTNITRLEQLHITFTSLYNISLETFVGLEATLKTLSLVNTKLKEIPQQSINKLKNLETLDLESNDIEEMPSYAFYGLPIVSLNLQANKINNLLEFSFGGLENTLEELVLISNKLQWFPLIALRRLRKLKILKLQSNQISQIPDDGFTRFTVLKNLDLQSNQIDHLDQKSFITMPKLVSLSLASNKLTVLRDSSIFVHLTDLETIDLSLNNLRIVDLNNHNNLRTIDLSNNHLHDIQFHNLPNLKELFVSHNNILKITNETFINTTMLSVLYLQHNAINSLSHNSFHSLHHLLTLDLSYNELKQVQPTLLKNCNKLQSLYLDNNLIVDTGLEPGVFQELVELRDLRLQKNLLQRIRKGVFYSLPNLQELDLQMNSIEMIESLESLANLQHLNIQSNKLIEIGVVLSKYPSSLRFLQLSYNQISRIHDESLSGQNHLEVLWLNYNKLHRLTRYIFRDLTEVENIYLDHNEIAVIEDFAFSSLKKLIYLNLEYNNLNHLSSNIFDGALNLIELRLCSSNIMDIEPNALQSLKMLKYLDLSHNHIYAIKKYMFSGNLPIEQLILSNMMAEQIESNSFMDLTSLQSLDVSKNNFSLTEIDFLFMPKLTYLDLSGNNLTNILFGDNLFSPVSISRIEYLDLSNTYISINQTNNLLRPLKSVKVLKLQGNDIESLTHLDSTSISAIKELYLDSNQMDSVPQADVLAMMPNLEILSLSRNRIKHIEKESFRNSTYMRKLNISSNSVSVLNPKAFDNMLSLQQLDLSNNVIRYIAIDVFDNIQLLDTVNLDNNWLQCIPNNFIKSTLPNMKTLTLNKNPILRIREDLSIIEGFPALQTLSIDGGNLSIIASHDFFGFSNLEILSLKNNQIQKISPSAFRPLQRLETLDLSANELDILPEERMSGLSNLKKLNLTQNKLLELPYFSADLHELEQVDISFNRLTRINSFGHLADSVKYISLRHNMIGWIANNAFQNMTSLQYIDLTQNFLTHLSDSIFEIIEVRLETLLLSGNPYHCDCRFLSIYEWLQEHYSRLVLDNDRQQIICALPEKLKDHSIFSLHPIDLCPMPVISLLEISKLESTQVSLKWEVQNGTLVRGFTIEYYLTSERTPTFTHKYLSSLERHSEISELLPENWYTLCIEANGKYLRSESNKPIPYVIDHQKHFSDYITSNRKCLQVRTLSPRKKTLISLSTLGIIVGIIFIVVLILTLCVLLVVYKIPMRRRRAVKNDVPEEYITYRHFSLPSSENVYS